MNTAHPRGQILIVVAGGLVTLMLAVGLVIDTGLGFLARRDAQNVADLASLAGTAAIADYYRAGGSGLDGADVYAAINANATENGCSSPCTWTAEYVAAPASAGAQEQLLGPVLNGGPIPQQAQGVRVDVEDETDTTFMRVIGLDNVEVSTRAVALTASIEQIGSGVLLPIAMAPPANMVPGDVYNITDGKDGPGNFGWLSWTGSNSADTLANSVCTPDNPSLTVPVYVPGDPGKSNKKEMRDCLDGYIANGTRVLIPIWDGTHPGNGNHAQYRIVGFAAFVLTYRSQPAVDNIQGAFVEHIPLSTIPAGFNPPGTSDVAYAIGLIR
jgi:hypothetical protein